jgi:hypothetical protein
MATLKLTAPPAPIGRPHYNKYRTWLMDNFYFQMCAYCLISSPAIEIDHYEPQDYARGKVHSPDNLLTACRNCNGLGKGDFHPLHTSRRKLAGEKIPHFVIDPRKDDYATLFEVSENGSIRGKSGPSKDRADFNLALLLLTTPWFNNAREQLMTMLTNVEIGLQKPELLKDEPQGQLALTRTLDAIARYELFFHAFGIPINPKIKEEISKRPRSKILAG